MLACKTPLSHTPWPRRRHPFITRLNASCGAASPPVCSLGRPHRQLRCRGSDHSRGQHQHPRTWRHGRAGAHRRPYAGRYGCARSQPPARPPASPSVPTGVCVHPPPPPPQPVPPQPVPQTLRSRPITPTIHVLRPTPCGPLPHFPHCYAPVRADPIPLSLQLSLVSQPWCTPTTLRRTGGSHPCHLHHRPRTQRVQRGPAHRRQQPEWSRGGGHRCVHPCASREPQGRKRAGVCVCV